LCLGSQALESRDKLVHLIVLGGRRDGGIITLLSLFEGPDEFLRVSLREFSELIEFSSGI